MKLEDHRVVILLYAMVITNVLLVLAILFSNLQGRYTNAQAETYIDAASFCQAEFQNDFASGEDLNGYVYSPPVGCSSFPMYDPYSN